jgi:hypothetical protein
MLVRLIGALALAAMLATSPARGAFDETKYPDLKGQWTRAREPIIGGGQAPFDPSKPTGRGQQAPLTPEYQAIYEANLAEQATGGQGNWQGGKCLPVGMPGVMTLYRAMEIVITPATTYILIEHLHGTARRIYTDGRDWPKQIEPTFDGYSIGKWVDEDGDGRYDVLEIETRHLRGPRAYDPSGIPFHEDNKTAIKERLTLDKQDRDLLYNQITVIDNALSRPWTVLKKYRREPAAQPIWHEDICAEGQALIRVGKEEYFQSWDGYLMPIRKGQAPPDLRYFDQGNK